jgi:hypothetical protein
VQATAIILFFPCRFVCLFIFVFFFFLFFFFFFFSSSFLFSLALGLFAFLPPSHQPQKGSTAAACFGSLRQLTTTTSCITSTYCRLRLGRNTFFDHPFHKLLLTTPFNN